ncbi:MAG: radical SAM protein [Ardenticatenales bacterium]|nr:radical SAM protein [Ardenticatenales bacterium]
MYAFDEVAQEAEGFHRAVVERQPFRPLYVKIKLIYGCNLKCEMCNHWRLRRERPLAISRFMEVLDELAGLGCRKIHFTGGEPLLRPQVPELTAHATALGLRVNMTTNGTLVDKDLAKRLVESGLRAVNISLDSPERRTHDKVRGERGAWKKTVRAIEFFYRAAHKGKVVVRLNTVVSRLNYASLAALPDLAHQLGAASLNLIPVDDHCGEHLSLRRRDIATYNETIAPQIAERALALGLMNHESQAYPFGRTSEETACARRGQYALGWYDRHPCFAPWTHSLIDFNGQVFICCMTRDQIPPLGDLKTSSFTEIWTGNNYAGIRDLMHPPALAPCRRCDDFLDENRTLLQIFDGAQLKSENISLSS